MGSLNNLFFFYKIYNDSFELERVFVAAQNEVEQGDDDSDDEQQSMEVQVFTQPSIKKINLINN